MHNMNDWQLAKIENKYHIRDGESENAMCLIREFNRGTNFVPFSHSTDPICAICLAFALDFKREDIYKGETQQPPVKAETLIFVDNAQITNIRKLMTRNHEPMAVITLEYEGIISPTTTPDYVKSYFEVAVFPKTWQDYGSIIEDIHEQREFCGFSLTKMNDERNTIVLDTIMEDADEDEEEIDECCSCFETEGLCLFCGCCETHCDCNEFEENEDFISSEDGGCDSCGQKSDDLCLNCMVCMNCCTCANKVKSD